KAAVDAANTAAQPKAVAEAREQATSLAAAAGLALGAITSISNAARTPFYYGPFVGPYTGTFGPGKFCGIVRTSHLRHLANGKTKRVLVTRHRVCPMPPS